MIQRGYWIFAILSIFTACGIDRFGSAATEADASVGGGQFGGAGGAASGGTAGSAGVSGTGAAFGGGGVGAQGGSGGVSGGGTGGQPDSGVGGVAGGGAGGTAGIGGTVAWTPNDITNCVMWFDANDSTTVITAGTSVTSWTDKCGGPAAVASGSAMPQSVVVNGKPGIRCDGTDDQLVISGAGLAASTYSMFMVIGKGYYGADPQPIWSNRTTAAVPGGTLTFLGFYSRMYAFRDSVSPPAFTGDVGHMAKFPMALFEFVVSNTGREFVFNASPEGSSAVVASTATALRAGTFCSNSPGKYFGAYDLFEIVAYDRALVPAERQQVRSELAAKWGL